MFFSFYQKNSIELVDYSPWFLCEVREEEGVSGDISFSKTHLIADFIKLTDFASGNEINKAYVVIPYCLNNTSDWSLARLRGVSLAQYFHEGIENIVYRYELANEDTFLVDSLGLKVESELTFKPIIKFK
ncbi:hypothetical protein [Methylophilus sp. QUAN]|jgi:hypothetical protein|uniref:Uncharacterized protein n=1 Tax=Methylophilus glucosoxydans TaxID=752553 RepID=A0ABW3GIU1_9PROT|nr:hypothetical protein [Methylophilus sp. QUAN]MBF4990749.1 hypothetical protein [Methylophilus sp. QUAN]